MQGKKKVPMADFRPSDVWDADESLEGYFHGVYEISHRYLLPAHNEKLPDCIIN